MGSLANHTKHQKMKNLMPILLCLVFVQEAQAGKKKIRFKADNGSFYPQYEQGKRPEVTKDVMWTFYDDGSFSMKLKGQKKPGMFQATVMREIKTKNGASGLLYRVNDRGYLLIKVTKNRYMLKIYQDGKPERSHTSAGAQKFLLNKTK